MKFVVLGKYSTQGLAGFVKNPSDNRQEAAKKITEAAGGKLIDMMTLRGCLLYTSPSPRDGLLSRMPSSA